MTPQAKRSLLRQAAILFTILFFFRLGAAAAQTATTGSITGTVLDGATPVAGIPVGVFDTNEVYKTMSTTDVNGNYALSDLQLGTYKIYFFTYGTGYIAQWYNNAATFNNAQPIDLTAEIPTFNAGVTQLATGGVISGTISDAVSGSPISGVSVQVFDANNSEIWFSSTTNTEGAYSITGLRTGTYKIRFRAFGTNYITAWYYDGNENHADTDETLATPVDINGGSVLIDAKLTVGGTISGKVTVQETGAVLSGARVNVYSSLDNKLKGYATTGEQGTYAVSGLPSGSSYKVQFFERVVNNAGAGINMWYNDKVDIANADSVDVGAENVDAAFSGAVISGTVSNEEGGTLTNVAVTAYDNDGNVAATATPTGEDGAYKIEGLKRGSYKLHFQPSVPEYASEWYNDKTAIELADAVVVASLGDRLTRNAILLNKDVPPPSKAAKLIPIYKRLLLKKRCYIINGVRVCR